MRACFPLLIKTSNSLLILLFEKEPTGTLDYDEVISRPSLTSCTVTHVSHTNVLFKLCFLMVAIIFEMGPAGAACCVLRGFEFNDSL